MDAIMRGTNPTIEVEISPGDFLVSSITAVDFHIRNGSKVNTYTMDDLVIDLDANSVIKPLTEEETKAYDPNMPVIVQMKCRLTDGSVVGIDKLVFGVADMEGE